MQILSSESVDFWLFEGTSSSIECVGHCLDPNKYYKLDNLPKSMFIIGGYIEGEVAGVVNSFGVKIITLML